MKVLFQIILLRKDYQLFQLSQLVVALIFGTDIQALPEALRPTRKMDQCKRRIIVKACMEEKENDQQY
jgi:hypothetical protein